MDFRLNSIKDCIKPKIRHKKTGRKKYPPAFFGLLILAHTKSPFWFTSQIGVLKLKQHRLPFCKN